MEQPWTITRAAFIDQAKDRLGRKFLKPGSPFGTERGFEQQAAIAHRESVKRALAEGHPVPPKVMADYPSLSRRVALGEFESDPCAMPMKSDHAYSIDRGHPIERRRKVRLD